MKTITIRLTQEPQPGLFRVSRFSNTVQLSVGMLVKAEDVQRWCASPRVNVSVDGLSESAEDALLLAEGHDSEPLRHDALAVVAAPNAPVSLRAVAEGNINVNFV